MNHLPIISSDSCRTNPTANGGSLNSEQPSDTQSSAKPRNRTVWECFEAHRGRQIDKWAHYFPIYERHFASYVDRPVQVLEIGVDHGGSLQLWKEYFGPLAQITGLDIDPRCKEYEEDRIHIYTCNAADPDIECWMPGFDIVIDDGSHLPREQALSFSIMWKQTTSVYLIEDCHQGLPSLSAPDALMTVYPWVLVMERPKRLIRGTPSRPLREDEIEAQRLHSHV